MHELLISGNPEVDEYMAKLDKALQQSPAPLRPSQSHPEPMDVDTDDPPCGPDPDSSEVPTPIQHVLADEPELFPRAAETQEGKGESFMEWLNRDQFAGYRIDNIYYPFASKAEWDLASFLMRSSMTMKDIDDFLELQMVCGLLMLQLWLIILVKVRDNLSLSFKSAKELRSRAEILPSGPAWKSKTITYEGFPTKTPLILYYRDPLQCIEFLLKNPLIKDHLDLIPKKTFRDGRRVIGEWITSDGAWAMQVNFIQWKTPLAAEIQ